jgi:hypothetical protein
LSNNITVTMPMSDYELLKKRLDNARKESISVFMETNYIDPDMRTPDKDIILDVTAIHDWILKNNRNVRRIIIKDGVNGE